MFFDQLKLSNRYFFRGHLMLQSPLKIGSPAGGFPRTPDGQPLIPGATLRGAFRHHLERLLITIGRKELEPCLLRSDRDHPCLSVNAEAKQELAALMASNAKINELEAVVRRKLCPVCKLFGTRFIPSKLFFPDLFPAAGHQVKIGQRGGMGIDRITEAGRPEARYQYDVAERGGVFDFLMIGENLDADNQALLAMALLEIQRSSWRLGGGHSYGAGMSSVENLRIRYFDGVGANAEEKGKLLAYLEIGDEGLAEMDDKATVRHLKQWQKRIL